MTNSDFFNQKEYQIFPATVLAECPSNIALIKYWGKFEDQIPANPSLSFTLNEARTKTKIHFQPDEKFGVNVLLDGISQEKFAGRIEKYLLEIKPYLSWISDGSFLIETENTFPHGSGIASSASGFGALAEALMDLDGQFSVGEITSEDRLRKTSFLARLGSGSACRSIYRGMAAWGKTRAVANSSNLFAVPLPPENIHPIFHRFYDSILIVESGEKKVSSTAGHGLMKTNPYARTRFQEADHNLRRMIEILQSGDLEGFIQLVEHEALTLHAMMITSTPAYILMSPKTLEAISRIWDYRKETGNPLMFTLDAGANIHLLYPKNESTSDIQKFIESELLPLSAEKKIIHDIINF